MWLMWHVSPNRYEVPVSESMIARNKPGRHHPAMSEDQKNFRPVTTCQQICRCMDNERRKPLNFSKSISRRGRTYSPHIIAANPPNSKKAPERAQIISEYISFGVIASWHCSGLAPKGMMKPNYDGQLLSVDNRHRTTYLQEAYRDD